MRRSIAILALLAIAALPLASRADDVTAREATLAKVGATLAAYGQSDVGVAFVQPAKNKWNYTATLSTGLTNAQALEVVVSVGTQNTIDIFVYPHYKGGYVNIATSKRAAALTRTLLKMNSHTFFDWGADDDNDVYASYKFTLESGYPEASIRTVLQSIPLLDQYVGEFTPYA
jgi:hypothetical protein